MRAGILGVALVTFSGCQHWQVLEQGAFSRALRPDDAILLELSGDATVEASDLEAFREHLLHHLEGARFPVVANATALHAQVELVVVNRGGLFAGSGESFASVRLVEGPSAQLVAQFVVRADSRNYGSTWFRSLLDIALDRLAEGIATHLDNHR